MFVTQFQKAVTYLRESQVMALFTAMSKSEWLAEFRASPLFYVVMPFIGLLLTVSALINGYQLAKSSNHNFDRWLLFSSSMICSILASISLYGAAISMALGVSFVAGPWLFLSSLVGTLSYQLVMFGLNSYRALESPIGSIQRTHYIQSALNNLFAMTISTAAIGTFIFVTLFPVAPVIGSVCALSAVALTFCNVLWRVIPPNGKQVIKGWFHLSKPDLSEDATATQTHFLKPSDSSICEKMPEHHRLFTHNDYSAIIRKMDIDEAKSYITTRIQQKLSTYVQDTALQDEKTKDKVSLLKQLLSVVKNSIELSKKDSLAKYPLAFQSFWAEKGDVEQLFDAVIAIRDKFQQSQMSAVLSPRF